MTTAVDKLLTEGWTKARHQPKERKAWTLPKNIFAGRSIVESAVIEKVKVIRLNVSPKADEKIPRSYAVVDQRRWQVDNLRGLPFSLKWQQSLPARWDFSFELLEGIRCLGLGERYAGLNLRGGTHTLCASDSPDHDEGLDAMYISIPFLILSQGRSHIGLFLDSPAPQRWHLDSNLDGQGHIELFSRRGWQLYIIGPAALPEVVRAYTALTGRHSLPPQWAMGYFQCRWSYPDERTVRSLAKEFRSRRIPCDVIVLDIDYMEEYRVFTISRDRFPRFREMILDLAQDNFKAVTIVDPGVKQDLNYKIFQEALSKDLFCKMPDGKLFLEEVWPGISAFPDFLKSETRKWWAQHLRFYTDLGISGIWNDMNEPTFFVNRKVLPEECHQLPEMSSEQFLQEDDETKVGHLEVRNLYGSLMCEATREGLLTHQPNKRPFVLTRSAYAGIQRHAATWLGDNKSYYEQLGKSVPMLLNMGLSGAAFSGVDVGG